MVTAKVAKENSDYLLGSSHSLDQEEEENIFILICYSL